MQNSHSMSRGFNPAPQPNVVKADLRELLESNLVALHALLEEQGRVLEIAQRSIAGLRAEVRTLASQHAPWVKALTDTRALLFVALREVVMQNEPNDTIAFERVSV
jgi:hypothetical protein